MKSFPSWIPILRKSFLGLVVAATILATVWIEEDVRGEYALRRFAKECRDGGAPLDRAFYKPSPIADNQNLFLAPPLVRFYGSKDFTGAALATFERENPLPYEWMPILGHWQSAKRTDFTSTFALSKNQQITVSGHDSKKGAQLVLDRLKNIGSELDSLCEAAHERPESQIPFRADGYLAPTFGVLRYFTYALSLRAVAEVELGLNDDAFRDAYTSLRLIEGAVTFPSHLHLLLANPMGAMSLQPFWEGSLKGAWTEGQLATMQDLLSKFHPLRELPAALAAGRVRTAIYYEAGASRPPWMPDGWWKLNIVQYFQPRSGGWDPLSFDAAAERIDLDEIQRADAHFIALKRTISPFKWLARRSAWPNQIIVSIGAAQNSFTLGRTECALERYRLGTGRYPRALAQLLPAYMASLPRDVIDGETLRYTCEDGLHFRLYSIGLNGVDDHGALPGKPTSKNMAYFPWTSKEGDWVWPQAPVD